LIISHFCFTVAIDLQGQKSSIPIHVADSVSNSLRFCENAICGDVILILPKSNQLCPNLITFAHISLQFCTNFAQILPNFPNLINFAQKHFAEDATAIPRYSILIA